MKMYLVESCNLQLNDTSVKSVHRTREGAVKEMKTLGFIELRQDYALRVLNETDNRIIIGYPYTDTEEGEETIVIYIHEMEVQP